MEDVLLQLGLNRKEAQMYLMLAQSGKQSAQHLAELTDEKRPNTYALLDVLITRGIVVAHTKNGKRVFEAVEPSQLRKLIAAERARQDQASMSLMAVLPQLKSMYALANNKPGVVHVAGLEGFKTVLDDMSRSTTEVLLIASDAVVQDMRVFTTLRSSLLKRKEAGIPTRAIFHDSERRAVNKAEFAERGMDVRFLGNNPFSGEVEIYEDNTIFTAYQPELVTTVITNASIAETMRFMFEQLWQQAT